MMSEEEKNEPLPQVNNIDELVPFEGKIFNTDDDAYEFYSLFTRKSGFSIRRTNLVKKESGKNPSYIYKREFICHLGGIVKQCKENDASDVLKLWKSLKDIDDPFKYEFTIDESNKLEHIIWAFGDSIWAYESFGDVVVFDSTYKIKCYEMPLGIWVGVDNHGNSIFFGCVLLQDEKISSFTWALMNFLAFVEGKYPKTILINQDLALKEVIRMELPNTN